MPSAPPEHYQVIVYASRHLKILMSGSIKGTASWQYADVSPDENQNGPSPFRPIYAGHDQVTTSVTWTEDPPVQIISEIHK